MLETVEKIAIRIALIVLVDKSVHKKTSTVVEVFLYSETTTGVALSMGLDDVFLTGHGLWRREQRLIQLVGCLLVHLGKNMGVSVKGDADVSMAQAMLYDLSVDASCDHGSSITMTKIM